MLLGAVGALIAGWTSTLFSSGGATGLNMDTVYSAGIASIGAVISLTLYHIFLRRRML